MIAPQALALALGGEVAGRQVLAPGPGHSLHDRSLAVRPDPHAPGGFVVHSFAGDDPLACKDHVRAALGLPAWRPGLARAADPAPKPRPKPRALPPPAESAGAARQLALHLWQEADPLCDSLAAPYLACRRIAPEVIRATSGHALRFHARCPRGRGGERLPALLGLIRDAVTGEPIGVHRTFLGPCGRAKVADGETRMVLGGSRGGVVMLSPDEEVAGGLSLAEGLETALSRLTAGWRPVWAALTASNLAQVPPLAGVEALTVFADHDANGTGERWAAAAVRRWRAAGHEAHAFMPERCGRDYNDPVEGRP